ncbi:hypothetical protein TVAG_067800 [Trichomonas vaginalis G3]|uniref:RRM domain-containing protein n=1 Tax=Trichomonas vaginalis (strain ATCC PRA-98 / G3) TaxID=412133 RepID=A2EMG4_TRIV3|nr:RNA-binding domain, RBD family-containing protein [Trichomonas vaginalis G3]EAY06120.1 hypothetical protein TVAG_067800 [Trichomonas vaginalis G3]KAI5516943.1 RNA-binding domain, RBD family-containing protein [Trichomonas vaginalis G3]|eukprot:XP_001318343.1 hypothetical protein [Trichomonas vaginalis G3]
MTLELGKEVQNVILVKNLPNSATPDDVSHCFSKYGNVMAVSLCNLSYLNTYYTLQMAYVKFDCQDPIVDIIENDIDVVLDGYYLEIEPVIGNKLVWNSIILLGVGVSIKRHQIEEALEQFSSPKILILKNADKTDNGYCIAEFPNPKYVRACLECSLTLNISGIPTAVRPFPPPIFHYVRISPLPIAFQNLKGVDQFNDFTFKTPEKDFACSSMVAAFTCDAIRKGITDNPPMKEFKIEIPGDFTIIYDAIYGSAVKINKDNCHYVYTVANILEYAELARIAGLVFYEQLTPSNVIKIYNSLYPFPKPPEFIVEFLAMHLHSVPGIDTLPKPLLHKVFAHPLFKGMQVEETEKLKSEFPNLAEIINEESIHYGNIENDREFIALKLQHLDEMTQKAEFVRETIQRARTSSVLQTQPRDEEQNMDQMHNDDREQMRRNLLLVDNVQNDEDELGMAFDVDDVLSDSDSSVDIFND